MSRVLYFCCVNPSPTVPLMCTRVSLRCMMGPLLLGFFLSKRDYCHSEHCVRPGCELDPKAGQITLVDPLTMNGKQIFLHCCFGGKEMFVVCVSSCSIDTPESNNSEQNSISSSSRQQLITAPSFQAEPSVGKKFFLCHCGFNWSHQSS